VQGCQTWEKERAGVESGETTTSNERLELTALVCYPFKVFANSTGPATDTVPSNVGKDAVLTPTHTGTQPDAFTRDGKKVRPLGPENDLAFKLVNQLDAKQRAVAVRGARPKNLVLGPGQDGKTVATEGIKGSALSKEQRGVLLELIEYAPQGGTNHIHTVIRTPSTITARS
jgi:hypothetical protein